jgi:hypothetical protein
MPMAQLIITAVTLAGRTNSEVARDYGVSRYCVVAPINEVKARLAEVGADLADGPSTAVDHSASDFQLKPLAIGALQSYSSLSVCCGASRPVLTAESLAMLGYGGVAMIALALVPRRRRRSCRPRRPTAPRRYGVRRSSGPTSAPVG